MPFVHTPKLLLGHMQDQSDPVRAAAEKAEQELAQRLMDVWTRPGTGVGARMKPALVQAWADGNSAMRAQIGNVHKLSVSFEFNRLAPESLEAADEWAGRLVREVTEDIRATVNDTVAEGIKDGLGPEELARNIGDGIGLTAAQARAVRNYRQALVGQDPRAFTYRLRDQRFDPATEAAFDTGVDLTDDQVDQRVAAYRRRYLGYRANTIARYETLYASNAGAMAAIRSSGERGLLPAGATKRWMLAHDERVCPRCRSIVELQPDGVALDGVFEWRHGKHQGTVSFPPLHPDCRCTISFRVR